MARTKKYNPPYDFPKYGHKLQNNKSGLTDDQLLDRTVWIGLYGEQMTKSRAARVLGRCRKTIYNMIEDGRLREEKNGMISTRSAWAYAKGVKLT